MLWNTKCYYNIFGIILLYFVTQTQQQDTSVIARTSYDFSKGEVSVSCTVTNIQSPSATRLVCPLVPGDNFCFENCNHVCKNTHPSNTHCRYVDLLEKIKCNRIVVDSKQVTTYIIRLADVLNNETWYCSHGGVNSNPFNLNVQLSVKQKVTTPKPIDSNKNGRNRNDLKHEEQNLPVQESTTKMSNKNNQQQDKFYSTLTKGDLIITVIVLLLLSLVVNMIFCIRCLLVRKYIRSQKKKMTHGEHSCLEFCLCIKKSKGNDLMSQSANNHHGEYDDLHHNAYISANGGHKRSHSQITTGSIPAQGGTITDSPGPRNYTYASVASHAVRAAAAQQQQHPNSYFSQPIPLGQSGHGYSSSTVLIPTSVLPDGNVLYMVQPAMYGQASHDGVTGSHGALRASQIVYDEVPRESITSSASVMYNQYPIRTASSTGSLYPKGSRRSSNTTTNRMASPLPEEGTMVIHPLMTSSAIVSCGNPNNNNQGDKKLFEDSETSCLIDNQNTRENDRNVIGMNGGSRNSLGDTDDMSSFQDSASGSAKGANTERLEMSRNLLQKADSLLKEAGTLLK